MQTHCEMMRCRLAVLFSCYGTLFRMMAGRVFATASIAEKYPQPSVKTHTCEIRCRLALLSPCLTQLLATAPLASSTALELGCSRSTLQQLTFFSSAKDDQASSCGTRHTPSNLKALSRACVRGSTAHADQLYQSLHCIMDPVHDSLAHTAHTQCSA
jgi:hypothetical protein